MKNPYKVILSRHVTEKATTLQELQNNNSNRSVARCKTPKYVFIVDPKANKKEIAEAIEAIYNSQSVKVRGVNTINVKSKPKRRTKGRAGATASFKKAIVTLEPGDNIENV